MNVCLVPTVLRGNEKKQVVGHGDGGSRGRSPSPLGVLCAFVVNSPFVARKWGQSPFSEFRGTVTVFRDPHLNPFRAGDAFDGFDALLCYDPKTGS